MGVQSLKPGCVLSSEHVERRLAAILAVDVAGYSRLMGVNEEDTLAQLKAVRRTLVDLKIGESVTLTHFHKFTLLLFSVTGDSACQRASGSLANA